MWAWCRAWLRGLVLGTWALQRERERERERKRERGEGEGRGRGERERGEGEGEGDWEGGREGGRALKVQEQGPEYEEGTQEIRPPDNGGDCLSVDRMTCK
jgi:hypothetical protein